MRHDTNCRVGVRREVYPRFFGAQLEEVAQKPWILVAVAVVFLAPQRRGLDVVERGDITSPFRLGSHLQKFRVLLNHGCDDAQEGLIRREDGVATGTEEQEARRGRLGKLLTVMFWT